MLLPIVVLSVFVDEVFVRLLTFSTLAWSSWFVLSEAFFVPPLTRTKCRAMRSAKNIWTAQIPGNLYLFVLPLTKSLLVFVDIHDPIKGYMDHLTSREMQSIIKKIAAITSTFSTFLPPRGIFIVFQRDLKFDEASRQKIKHEVMLENTQSSEVKKGLQILSLKGRGGPSKSATHLPLKV